jgi:HJR/Mrr/RecB family endonuclease
VTQASSDYGIDVWAIKDEMITGIQVKKWKSDVGFDDVAKTIGSNMSKANKYILISTTSFFTPQALEHQRQHSTIIELWDTNRFRKEIRENFSEQTIK